MLYYNKKEFKTSDPTSVKTVNADSTHTFVYNSKEG